MDHGGQWDLFGWCEYNYKCARVELVCSVYTLQRVLERSTGHRLRPICTSQFSRWQVYVYEVSEQVFLKF